jgi:hypothetical protein
MADFAKHLPLSQRTAGDESGVSADRRAAIADLIDEAASLLARADASDPDAVGSDVRAGVTRGFLADAALRLDADDLTGAAAAVRAGKRRSVRELSRTLRALLRLADTLGERATLSPLSAGSVALYAATSAPFDRRAVVRGHTLRATDQDWSFGRGPVLEASAEGILRFLLALSDEPPRRPADPEAPAATVEG